MVPGIGRSDHAFILLSAHTQLMVSGFSPLFILYFRFGFPILELESRSDARKFTFSSEFI